MDIAITEPKVTISLSVDEAMSLYDLLEYCDENGIARKATTPRALMGELGAVLEDAGHFDGCDIDDYDPDDDPDPEPMGQVIAIDVPPLYGLDPSVEDWCRAIADVVNFGRERHVA